MEKEARFEVIKGVMSIDKLSKLSSYNIPRELLAVINKELNEIPKQNDGGFVF